MPSALSSRVIFPDHSAAHMFNGLLPVRRASPAGLRAALLGLALAIVVVWAIASVPAVTAILAGATFLLAAIPGVAVLERLRPGAGLPNLVFGSVAGLLFARTAMFLVYVATRDVRIATLVTSAALVSSAVVLWRKGTLAVPPAQRWDATVSALIGAAALVAIAGPYSRIGMETDLGHVFLPYFGKDFFNHVSIVAELVRGGPLENPYLSGTPLHYYWFSHLWPAAIAFGGATAQEALSATIPLAIAQFVGCAMALARTVLPRGASALAVLVALFAYSYIGWLYVAERVLVRLSGVLAGPSSLPYSFLGHAWYRDFLYEPHALAALCCLMLALHLTGVRPGSTLAAALCGLAAGGALLSDSFLGLVGVTWLMLLLAARWWRGSEGLGSIVCAGGIAAAMLATGFAAGIFPSEGGALQIHLHSLAWLMPGYLPVELGPLFLIGLAGGYLAWTKRLAFTRPYVLLALVALGFALLVRTPMDADVALRKITKILMIPGMVLTGVAIGFGEWSRRQRSLLAVVCLAATVTFATDLYQHVVFTNRPVPDPVVVSGDMLRAYQWVRAHTPRDWSVQRLDEVRPHRRFPATSATTLPGLTERRALFGNYELPYLFQVPHVTIEARRLEILRVFDASSAAQVSDAIRALPPHALLVDDQGVGPVKAVKDAVAAGQLTELFRSGSVSVVSAAPLPRQR